MPATRATSGCRNDDLHDHGFPACPPFAPSDSTRDQRPTRDAVPTRSWPGRQGPTAAAAPELRPARRDSRWRPDRSPRSRSRLASGRMQPDPRELPARGRDDPASAPRSSLTTAPPPGASSSRQQVEDRLGERLGAQPVDRAPADRRRRQIAQHELDRPAGQRAQARRSSPASKMSPWSSRGARDRRHLEQIDPDHAAAARRPRPAAQPPGALPRSSTRRPGAQQRELRVDLEQLVGRPRAVAVASRALCTKRSLMWRSSQRVELAGRPLARAQANPGRARSAPWLRRLVRRNAGALAAGAQRRQRRARPARASSVRPIRPCSMPSRRPRSATRSWSGGQLRSTASRIAQPATTRSARPGPMQGCAARSALLIARSRARDRRDRRRVEGLAVDLPAIVAGEAEVERGQRRDRAGGPEQLAAAAAASRSADLVRSPRSAPAALCTRRTMPSKVRASGSAGNASDERHHADRHRSDAAQHRRAAGRAAIEPQELGAAAADVDQQHVLGRGIDQRQAAEQRQPRLLLVRQDLEGEAR